MHSYSNPLYRCAAITAWGMCLMLPPFAQGQSTAATDQDDGPRTTTPAAIESIVTLGPDNSRISFVGIHVGDDPKPRLGGFATFQGQLKVNPETKAITSLHIDINVDSVWTEFAKLTAHLKNTDFFDVAQFPKSRFESTQIEMGENGQCSIRGILTLHGQTQAIAFDAQYRYEGGGLLLHSKFNLDRSQFGMDQMLSGVDKAVELEIVVGQKTSVRKSQQGHGGDSKKQPRQQASTNKQRLVSISLPHML